MRWLLLAFPGLVLMPALVGGSVVVEPTLADDVRSSTRIARVQLTSSKEYEYESASGRVPCGYVYVAQVVSAPLLGPSGGFTFFSQDRLPEPAAEYLVFVFDLTPDKEAEFREKVASLPEPYRAQSLCRLDTSPTHFLSTVMVLDPVASKALGGEWVRPIDPPNGYAAEGLPSKRVPGFEYKVIPWPEMVAAIKEALKAKR